VAATAVLTLGPWDSAGADVGEYLRYALAFWMGVPQFHVLPAEYPPLSMLPLSLALLPFGRPPLGFVVGMAAVFLLGYGWLRRFAGPRVAHRYALYLLLGAQGTLLGRYDLVPALVTAGALLCARRGRFGPAYALLALGAALKLYPAVLVPLVAIAQWRALREEGTEAGRAALRALRGVALFGALALAAVAGPALLVGADALAPFRYATSRPVQVESAAGSVVWLGTLAGVPARVVYAFVSQGFEGPLAEVVAAPFLVIFAAGYLWLCWRAARGRLGVDGAFLAALCLLLATSKVLSPQYLIWVLPVAATVGGNEVWWAAIALLTSLEYPVLYPYAQGIPPLAEVWPFMLGVAVRNVALVGLTARLVVGGRRVREVGEARPVSAPDAAQADVAPVAAVRE
jgi:hypothetical protein